jgi:hypothetical protein
MFSAIIDRIYAVPDHLQALFVVCLGAGMCLIHKDAGQALIAAGLAMWRGKQA